MRQDSLHERGQAMEDAFFRDRDKALISKMREEMAAANDRSRLAGVTGIKDVEVLNHLMAHGISSESLASVALIPLVAVAWADGKMEDQERDAILKAAEQSGISAEHASFELISSWMNQRPGADLIAAWKDYIRAIKETIEPAALAQLRNSVMGRAKDVANAAGGFMGLIGNKTSDVEQKVLDDLSAAFE